MRRAQPSDGFGAFTGQLDSLPWQQELSRSGTLTRYTSWLVAGDCTCDYKYGGKSHPFTKYPPWLVQLTSKVAATCGVDIMFLNSVCANKYVVDSHDLFWHTDNEPVFRESDAKRDTFIVSLSFGASRKFAFRRKRLLKRMQSHLIYTVGIYVSFVNTYRFFSYIDYMGVSRAGHQGHRRPPRTPG